MLSLEIVQLLKPIYTATPPSITKSISLVATCFQQSHYFQVVLSLLSPHPFHPSAYLSISILLITRSYSNPCFQIWLTLDLNCTKHCLIVILAFTNEHTNIGFLWARFVESYSFQTQSFTATHNFSFRITWLLVTIMSQTCKTRIIVLSFIMSFWILSY